MQKVFMAVYRRAWRHSKGELTARLCHGAGRTTTCLGVEDKGVRRG